MRTHSNLWQAICLMTLIAFLPAGVLAQDADGDGVLDSDDLCPLTTDLAGPIPTSGTLCDGCMGDDQTIHGCNASQIVECKSGPNRREIENGLRPSTQRRFESLKGWARKCGCDPTIDSDADGTGDCVDGCPTDPGKSGPGTCGCGTPDLDSDGDGTEDCIDGCPNDPGNTDPGTEGCDREELGGVVVDGFDTILELPGGSIRVPAGALPAGIEITLAEVDPDVADELPGVVGESLISNVFEVEFSESLPAGEAIVLRFAVPDPAPVAFRARMKVEGPFAGTEDAAPAWTVQVGHYDAARSDLEIQLFATGPRVSIVLVEADPDGIAQSISVIDRVTGALGSLADSLRTSILGDAEAQFPGSSRRVFYGERGWVAACYEFVFVSFGDELSCNQTENEYVAAVFASAGDRLIADRLLEGTIQIATRADLDRSGLTLGFADPGGASGSGPDAEFNLVFAVPEAILPDDGRYYVASGELQFQRPGDGGGGVRDADRDPYIAAHELTHASQNAYMPAIEVDWIKEGTATAMGYAHITPDAPALLARRFGSTWRDWSVPLDDGSKPHFYAVMEYWVWLGGGSLVYLRDLYDALALEGAADYAATDRALGTAGFGGQAPLADGYLGLIQERDSSGDYPYCMPADCAAGETCMGEPQGAVASMAADCLDVNIQDEDCPDGPFKLSLVSDDADATGLRLVTDATVYAVDETAMVDSNVRIWPVNTDFAPFSVGYGLHVEGCECGNGELEGDEECEDGNVEPGDGCDEECRLEGGDPFVDTVDAFDPTIQNGQPTTFYANPDNIIGPPDGAATSLGDSGRIFVRFVDNYVSGNGTAAADLRVVEIGPEVEWSHVTVTVEGVGLVYVGHLMDQSGLIDLDAYGIGVDSRVFSLQIRDDGLQGTQCCHDSVGADIDYVEALTSHPVCPVGAVCRD